MFCKKNNLGFSALLTLSLFSLLTDLHICAMEEQKGSHKEITEVTRSSLPNGSGRPYFLTRVGDAQAASINIGDHSPIPPIVAYSNTSPHRVVVDSLRNFATLERLAGVGMAGTPLGLFRLPSNTAFSQGVAISPDGLLVVITHFGTNNLTIYALRQDRLEDSETYELPPLARNPWGVVFAPDGSSIAITLYGSNQIMLIPIRDQRLVMAESAVYHLPLGAEGPRSVTYDRSGTALAIANYGSNSAVYASLRPRTTIIERFSHRLLPVGSSGPVAVLFSSEDSFVTANFLTRDLATFRLGATSTLVEEPNIMFVFLLACALYLRDTKVSGGGDHK